MNIWRYKTFIITILQSIFLMVIPRDLFTTGEMQLLHDVSTLMQNEVPANVHLKRENKKRFRILCFGDSLTQGYYGVYNHYHPYSTMLRNLLIKNYGDNFDVITAGVGGERVHKEMFHRLKKLLQEETFDLILILGGVNDLSTLDCINKIDLFSDIKLVHSLAHSQSIRTVAMTLLDAHVAPYKLVILSEKQFSKAKEDVNKKLRKMNSTLSVLCDTAAEFPLDSLPSTIKRRTWTRDNVHPTPSGYDELGRVIFECIATKIDLPT